jgi:hypothetical protein
MSVEQYATLPYELTLREVRIHVAQKGFRTKSLVVVVTTSPDAEEYRRQPSRSFRAAPAKAATQTLQTPPRAST